MEVGSNYPLGILFDENITFKVGRSTGVVSFSRCYGPDIIGY